MLTSLLCCFKTKYIYIINLNTKHTSWAIKLVEKETYPLPKFLGVIKLDMPYMLHGPAREKKGNKSKTISKPNK